MTVLGALVLAASLGAAPDPAVDPLTASPDVQFRVLEPKPFADALRHELVLYPFVPQVGSTFTTQWLTSVAYVFHADGVARAAHPALLGLARRALEVRQRAALRACGRTPPPPAR